MPVHATTPLSGPKRRWAIALAMLFTALCGRGADRTWDGGQDSFWANAMNWSGNIAPVAGDNLVFPSGNLQPSITTNNFSPGTVFGTISIASTTLQGYILGGNRITLTNGLTYSATALAHAPNVACDITLGADQVFTATRAMTLSGRLELNGHVLTLSPSGTGSIFLSGTVTNSATAIYAYVVKSNTGVLVIPSGANFQVPIPFGSGGDAPSLQVNDGTVQLDGAATNGNASTPVELQASGSGVITGTGIADSLQARNGGVISPGVNGPGVLSCNNAHSPFGTGILQLDINGTTPGTGYDQLVIGNPAWDGILDLRVGYSPQIGDTFLVVRTVPPNGNFFTPGGILDVTNGYSFGSVNSSNGFSLVTVRRADSPFALWKGNVSGTFPPIFSTAWSLSNNWASGVSPVSGGAVLVTEYGFHESGLSNDLATGFSLASLTFSGTNIPNNDCVLYGNPLTVTQGITNLTSVGTNRILLDLVIAGSLDIDVQTGSMLVCGGSFNGGNNVHKSGGGELLYTGNTANSFVGNLALDAGTLRVDGVFTDGAITVNSGTLSGTGTVSAVTLTSGVLHPGAGPGTFHIDGDLNAGAGAVCQFDLNGPIAGSGYDQLLVNGSVTLNGAQLEVVPNYAATTGTVFLLVVNDGSDAVTGAFAGLPEGTVFQAGGQYFSISYHAGSGSNDIVLTRVNAATQPAQFSNVTRLNANTVQFQGSGGTNVGYLIQASTNLAAPNWLDIGAAPSDGSGHFIFTDTNVTRFPQRFFRMKNP